MDFNEHLGHNRPIAEKIVGIPTILLKSQLLNYQTWILIDAKI